MCSFWKNDDVGILEGSPKYVPRQQKRQNWTRFIGFLFFLIKKMSKHSEAHCTSNWDYLLRIGVAGQSPENEVYLNTGTNIWLTGAVDLGLIVSMS